MDLVVSIIKIIGSVGLFLFGMQILSEGLQKSASGKLKKTLEMMTGNRLLSVLTGFLITVVIQSSSATTVMVVSFVNAGLMNLISAIGVILGANIGTTVTGWIVALLGFLCRYNHTLAILYCHRPSISFFKENKEQRVC